MILTLDRYMSPGKGVFGIMGVANRRFYTCENMWMGNMPNVSCVPAGWYKLEPYTSAKYPKTWALVNPDLRVYKHLVDLPNHDIHFARYACLFHVGNTTVDTEGCILPGKSLGYINHQWAVTSSGQAMGELSDILGDEDHTLHIRWKGNE